MYLNKAMIYGNLTRDPELKTLPNGTPGASFGVATNRTYKDAAGEKKEQTEFHTVTVFGKQAETVSQYLRKGSPAFIEGRLQTRSWDKDGVKQYRTEIVAEFVQFGPKSAATETAPAILPHDGVDDVHEAAAFATSQEASGAGSSIEYPSDEINPDNIPFS